MPAYLQSVTTYDLVLYLVIEVVAQHMENEWPSPTIEQLSNITGYSEEMILESLEYGKFEPVSILQ